MYFLNPVWLVVAKPRQQHSNNVDLKGLQNTADNKWGKEEQISIEPIDTGWVWTLRHTLQCMYTHTEKMQRPWLSVVVTKVAVRSHVYELRKDQVHKTNCESVRGNHTILGNRHVFNTNSHKHITARGLRIHRVLLISYILCEPCILKVPVYEHGNREHR